MIECAIGSSFCHLPLVLLTLGFVHRVFLSLLRKFVQILTHAKWEDRYAKELTLRLCTTLAHDLSIFRKKKKKSFFPHHMLLLLFLFLLNLFIWLVIKVWEKFYHSSKKKTFSFRIVGVNFFLNFNLLFLFVEICKF